MPPRSSFEQQNIKAHPVKQPPFPFDAPTKAIWVTESYYNAAPNTVNEEEIYSPNISSSEFSDLVREEEQYSNALFAMPRRKAADNKPKEPPPSYAGKHARELNDADRIDQRGDRSLRAARRLARAEGKEVVVPEKVSATQTETEAQAEAEPQAEAKKTTKAAPEPETDADAREESVEGQYITSDDAMDVESEEGDEAEEDIESTRRNQLPEENTVSDYNTDSGSGKEGEDIESINKKRLPEDDTASDYDTDSGSEKVGEDIESVRRNQLPGEDAASDDAMDVEREEEGEGEGGKEIESPEREDQLPPRYIVSSDAMDIERAEEDESTSILDSGLGVAAHSDDTQQEASGSMPPGQDSSSGSLSAERRRDLLPRAPTPGRFLSIEDGYYLPDTPSTPSSPSSSSNSSVDMRRSLSPRAPTPGRFLSIENGYYLPDTPSTPSSPSSSSNPSVDTRRSLSPRAPTPGILSAETRRAFFPRAPIPGRFLSIEDGYYRPDTPSSPSSPSSSSTLSTSLAPSIASGLFSELDKAKYIRRVEQTDGVTQTTFHEYDGGIDNFLSGEQLWKIARVLNFMARAKKSNIDVDTIESLAAVTQEQWSGLGDTPDDAPDIVVGRLLQATVLDIAILSQRAATFLDELSTLGITIE